MPREKPRGCKPDPKTVYAIEVRYTPIMADGFGPPTKWTRIGKSFPNKNQAASCIARLKKRNWSDEKPQFRVVKRIVVAITCKSRWRIESAGISAYQRIVGEIQDRGKGVRKIGGNPDRPGLSDTAAAVYEILLGLPEYRAVIGTKLLDALASRGIVIDQSTLTGRVVPELLPYGIENIPRKGYRIRPSERPK